MKPWQIIRSLAGVEPKVFIAAGFGVFASMYVLTLVPGLILRRFFDDLSDGASAGSNMWTYLGLLVAVGMARAITL
ncbi:MAG TPA: hypothetical protein VD767_11940, partial [Thermomicrobiales bacterium]|nr:hypothetical protein [Thermomicrobiales bacterium]